MIRTKQIAERQTYKRSLAHLEPMQPEHNHSLYQMM